MGFWPSKALLSAVELGLFTTLGGGAMTGSELQAGLQLHPRANPDFFDTLVALAERMTRGDWSVLWLRKRSSASVRPSRPGTLPQWARHW